jgi:hypothetical protein
VRTSLEEKIRQYRAIYENVSETPRIKPAPLSKIMKLRPSVVETRIEEAFNLGYVVRPQIRKRSYSNFKEYMYFINYEDPYELYEQYIKDKNVVYHAVTDGFSNFFAVSKDKFDIEGDVVIEGCRSDYHISFAPDHSWEKAIQIMKEKVSHFDPDTYLPRGIIKTHWDETIPWDVQDEILFGEFKYNLRNPVTPVTRKHHIRRDKVKHWLKTLPETCTFVTGYFPKTISMYDPYVLMVETEYEDFIVDLFSVLPTTSWFFKVSGKLLLYLWVDRGSMQSVDFPKPDVSKLHIPLLLRSLSRKGIIKNKAQARVECCWREGFEG